MQEHPVPQNVTSYEFHLIGSMTLKQFLELAACGVLAFLAYSSNLPTIFKIPLILFFILFGIAMAFLPIEERPLDIWILSFLRAIYNPTKFHWKKTIRVPDLFDFTTKTATVDVQQSQEEYKPERSSRVAAYFQSISTTIANEDAQEDLIQRAFSVTQMYDSVPAAKDVVPAAPHTQLDELLEKPDVTIRVHGLKAPPKEVVSGTITISSVTPAKEPQHISLPTVLATQNLVEKAPVELANNGASPLSVAHPISPAEENATRKVKTLQYQADQAQLHSSTAGMANVQTNATLPFPKTPTTPNVVVGMVLDHDGRILENAIIEIRTLQGFPARALKSNKLGQFFASTPLPKGEYEIVVEKDSYVFAPQKLTIENKIIAPLEMIANPS